MLQRLEDERPLSEHKLSQHCDPSGVGLSADNPNSGKLDACICDAFLKQGSIAVLS